MQVTVLYVEGCPHRRIAEERVAAALGRLGRTDAVIARQRVATDEDAETWGFRGSPTVLVDGRDVFGDAAAPQGLACRLYPTDEGLSGAPTVEQLVEVLGSARPV